MITSFLLIADRDGAVEKVYKMKFWEGEAPAEPLKIRDVNGITVRQEPHPPFFNSPRDVRDPSGFFNNLEMPALPGNNNV